MHFSNLYVMPCYDNANTTLSTKIVSSFPKNQDIPKIMAWLFAFNSTDGQLEAVSSFYLMFTSI